MRAQTLAKINRGRDLPACQVNDTNQTPVRSGLADAGVAVNRDKSAFAIGRGDDFVARDAILRDGGQLSSGGWVNNAQSLVAFIGDKQPAGGAQTRCEGKGSHA